MRLSDLRPGSAGQVVQVHSEGAVGQRLMEMGMIEGTLVRVLRVAPFGGPMQIALDRALLSIRRAEAEGVEVTS
jgi:ferrous iron transport protein A